MVPFDIQLPTRTVFGRGKAQQTLEGLLGTYKNPLIVHGADPQRVSWLLELFDGYRSISCAGEPDIIALEAALQVARGGELAPVIAVGGGSVIDLGKAIAGLAATKKPLLNYLEVVGEGKPIDADPLPFIAIATTSGTGAEATKNAVIGVPEHRRKVSIRDARMLADLAIVDPALTEGCPRSITLASGLDAITQLIEPYVSSRANAFTDAIIRQALEPALVAIRQLANGEDPDARDAMAYASYMSGIALSHAGLGAVHGLAGVVGGITGAAHGEICAALLVPALVINREKLKEQGQSTERLDEIEALLARHFAGYRGSTGFERLSSWVRNVGMRGPSDLGLDGENTRQIATLAQNSSSMKANPADLSIQDLSRILSFEG